MIRFYGGDGTLLLIQFCAVLFIFGWTVVIFTPFTFFLRFINCLRIDALEEEVGMDISRHKGPAYRTDGVDEAAIDDLNQSRHAQASRRRCERRLDRRRRPLLLARQRFGRDAPRAVVAVVAGAAAAAGKGLRQCQLDAQISICRGRGREDGRYDRQR